jgi:glycosyltransferase involved in cell wall biosynthesis
MIRVFGAVPARLATFFWVAFSTHPDMVGGFHLLVNGLAAALAGKMIGARSVYFCVGGPAEVLNGGLLSENRVFEKLRVPDSVIEKQLLKTVAAFDLVITMGSRAIKFFRERGVRTKFHIVCGGLDDSLYRPSQSTPVADVIWVGRLAPVKRLDILLRALRVACNSRPDLKAIVVGNGPLRKSLETMARELEIDGNVRFVGFQQDVASWLKQAKLVVLTSESEGLSLAMMEAMLCGLPAVVSKVGDLEDLVEHGVNGYLVSQREQQVFASHLLDLLGNSERLNRFSIAARRSAARCETLRISKLWDSILTSSGDLRDCDRTLKNIGRMSGKPV